MSVRRRAMAAVLAVALCTGLAGADAPPPGDVIRVKGVRGDTVVALLPSVAGGLVRADVMASHLAGTLDTVAGGRWRLTLSGTTVEFEPGLPFAAYNGFALPLLEAPRVHEGTLHLPLQVFSEILPRFGIGLLWDRSRWEVRLFQAIARRDPAPANRPAVSGGGTTAPTTPVAATSGPARLPSPSGAATPAATAPTPAPSQPSTTAPAEGTSTAPAGPAAQPAAPARPREPNAPPGLSRRYTIAVDAGHGGRDPGNAGVVLNGRRVNESVLTLQMATRLASELRSRGLEVVLTRDADELVPLEQRGPIANRRRADLFVSLHTNAANPNWRNGSAVRGVETFFLSTARTEDERRVAAMENEVVRFEVETQPEEGDPLGFILNDIAQNEHLRESFDLATLVNTALAAKHPGPNRGVKQAGFMVLAKAFMPAILVEVGFGTNVDDARWMASTAGQREIAESISDAVFEYLRHYERRTGVAGR